MKKRCFLFFVFLFSLLTVYGQNRNYLIWLGPYSIDEGRTFETNRERKKVIFETMYAQAQTQQENLRLFLTNQGFSFRSLQVINAVLLSADAADLLTVQLQFPHYNYVDISDWKYKAHSPVFMSDPEISARAIGVAEPGLIAVGARQIWQMGYSGKGVSVLSFDTGVWPDHEAIKDRFMANFFPYKQTWQGYFSPVPVDKGNSHGTHTIGTMLGLHKTNQDTIGLAFEGYYMATDPIVSDLAFLLPLDSILSAYNWALNPDGNPATTYDIPDVICNSWGWVDPPDSSLCTGFMENLLFNIELVGIANEYSAGNDGPAAISVGAPALVSSNVVNAFSVGAVDAHDPAWPIANFSSRGPGVCGNNPSLIIKPEVVAPGVQVRSAVVNNGYSAYNGTSMAGPHVAGALMLLREAFPQASARELKEALYFSAIDLGDPGEDNTYGMGMISIPNAFTYLQNLGYSPANPALGEDDLAVFCVNPPPYWACSADITPQYRIRNNAQTTIDTLHIQLMHNGNLIFANALPVFLAPGDSMLFTAPNALNLDPELNETWLSVSHNAYAEPDLINNNSTFRTYYQMPRVLPYANALSFTGGDTKDWEIRNPDRMRTWEFLASGGLQFCDTSAVIRFPAYTSNVGVPQQDLLISPPVDLPQSDNLYVSFWVAYAKRLQNQKDSVELMIQTDCKDSFSDVLYSGHTQNAATVEQMNPVLFVPSEASHWKRHVVKIPSNYSQNKVYFAFRSKNYKGGSFWLGKFAVHEGSEFVGTEILNLKSDILLYPNPTTDILHLEGSQMGRIKVLDMQGRLVRFFDFADFASSRTIDVESLQKGVYMLEIETAQGRSVLKFIR